MKPTRRKEIVGAPMPLRVCLATVVALLFSLEATSPADRQPASLGGELRIIGPKGKDLGVCPLKHTAVKANVTGFVSRVRVRQHFSNPLDRKIEAVYVFPLPQDAAVDDMVMTVGDRRMVGRIKPRDEARRIYEAARRTGHVTSLLDQERPNIFTQSVANIEPGEEVVIEIAYVQTLAYEDGRFEFVFPMVVGPRYVPGKPTGRQATGWSPDTSQVADASRISPPVAVPGTRAGHDISVTVKIDAGSELFDIESHSHAIVVKRGKNDRATVTLEDRREIPNKDFILRYRAATDQIEDAFFVHKDKRGKFFTLILQPPRRVSASEAIPKEMILVIDRSGSMSGFPIEKAKEVMRLAIESMNPRDTFNLLSFSGGTGTCFPEPVPNTAEHRVQALRYLADMYGSGGTEMMPAIRAALEGQPAPGRVRIVAFMTDGYIGNDFEIIDAVRENAGTARVFAFGIGNAVNRFLLDGMAHAGRGEVEYVTLRSQADAAIARFVERIRSPVLTDIAIDWSTLPVADVYPRRLPDLFSAKPIMIHGRLTGPARGTVALLGKTRYGVFERQIEVRISDETSSHEVIPSLWARAAVADLMMSGYRALQRGSPPNELREKITRLGVDFHLVTRFTSFVAVEEMTVTVRGEPTTIAVPVEMPEGVSYEGVFGGGPGRGSATRARYSSHSMALMSAPSAGTAPAWRLNVQGPRPVGESLARRVGDTPTPDEKLAESLRGLADKVVKEGKDGDLTLGSLQIRDYKVEVIVYLDDLSPRARASLEKVGFVRKDESKTARVLVGTIDVRKLVHLAKLGCVVSVTPASAERAS